MTKSETELETLLRITQIDQEVERLLGMGEEDSLELLLKSNALLEEIDTIYLKKRKNEVKRVYRNISEIHRQSYPKELKEMLLKKEEMALHRLYLLVEEMELSAEEEERIEMLYRKLEALNGSKELSEFTIAKVESLLDEKEMLAYRLREVD